MTHVFIVNETTLKYHLEYMFAGTGANCDAPFLNDAGYHNPKRRSEGLTNPSERNIAAMIADISRVHAGDKIIFYLQAGNHEGKFYGIFKAAGTPFYDSNKDNYLSVQMGKNLNLRVIIEPDEVYENGVSEHKVLDLLDGIGHPSEMCWSLIYRKLKGNRGCTMITDYEAAKLSEKIRSENAGRVLPGASFSYDASQGKIVRDDKAFRYTGDKKSVSVEERLLVKYFRKNAFEAHLQAYVVQKLLDLPLSDLLHIDSRKAVWIGNEVSCGVGMQRIDVVTVQEDIYSVDINIIELKDEEPYEGIITNQLPWYIEWVKNYWCPLYAGKRVNINPVVIAKKAEAANSEKFKKAAEKLKYPIQKNAAVSPAQYIAFRIGKGIVFEKVF